MKRNFVIKSIIVGLIGCCLSSCKKYLDEKQDDKINTIATILDAQLMLDNYSVMNMRFPTLMEIQVDDYYLSTADYNSRNEVEKSYYTWQRFESTGLADWELCYEVIFISNSVLEAHDKIMTNRSETTESRNVLGSALFFRSHTFYALSQLFAPIYDENSASKDLGIPLRLDPDFSVKSTRATNEQVYTKIIADLKLAVNLLPVTPTIKSRPSKPAAYGALAKIYLSMRDYANAGLYADSCLQLYSELIDFNTLSKTSAAPFTRFNKEVIFHTRSPQSTVSSITPTRAKIDDALYQSYNSNDLRKTIYFRANTGAGTGTYNFKGNYDAQATTTFAGVVFGGIVTDEMYLIRAEAYARTGNANLAMKDLNTLLKTRWQGTFNPLTALDAADALKIILRERRKELLYRGTRWVDLRRLSKEPEHAVTPKRNIDGTVYDLQPGSPRYITTIPIDVIRLSGMQQNP